VIEREQVDVRVLEARLPVAIADVAEHGFNDVQEDTFS
jgi:hypothetical protein